MTVREIIIAHLRSIGADGLCRDGCGCDIDEICPWLDTCNDWPECVPAKRVTATEAGEYWEEGDTIYEEMK